MNILDNIDDRVVQLARYIIETGDTVRKVAKVFNVSKSTVIQTALNRTVLY